MLFKIYFIYSQQNDVDTFFKPKQCNGFFLVKIWFKRGVMREGVQSSSNSNHRHPNLFCGKRAPQLVTSTTPNSNHPKKA